MPKTPQNSWQLYAIRCKLPQSTIYKQIWDWKYQIMLNRYPKVLSLNRSLKYRVHLCHHFPIFALKCGVNHAEKSEKSEFQIGAKRCSKSNSGT